MPTYEYECTKCGNRFEIFQRMTDPPRKRCGACRGAVRRIIGTGAGLLFKGSGFYTTDYRSDSYQKAEKAEKTSTAASKSESGSAKKDKPKKGAATS